MSGAATKRRHPPAVYRRRRLVLLLIVLAVAAAVWLLIAQPWRGAATENEAAPPPQTQDAATALPVPGEESAESGDAEASESAATEPAAESVSTPPPGAAACAARDLTVEALTDKDAYGSGQNPLLSIRLTNSSEVDCTLNVGTTTQSFIVSSGSDTWWRSTDCQSTPSDMIVLLAAGQSVTSATPLAWDRTRSSVDTCGSDSRQAAPGGGASYHLSVEIGGVPSSRSQQFLLY